MNWNEISVVSPSKIEALRKKMERLGIDLRNVEEQFTKGGGKGGQKINKTSNAVILRYAPLDLVVKSQRERQRSLNRFLALRELVEQIEMKISPATSDRLKNWEKIRRQKDRRRRRNESPEG